MLTKTSPPQFAELALPLPLKQTFTYRLTENIRPNVKIGCRMLVPFGKRTLTGYTVGLHENLEDALDIEETQIRDVIELLDDVPLLTDEILRLTNWTADYYSASWGEVLKASLPAGINVETEQIVQITSMGRDELVKASTAKTAKVQLLQYLAEHEEISIRSLSRKFGASTAGRIVRDLVKQNWVTSVQRTLSTKAKPKRRKAVRLLPNFKRIVFNEKQEQVIRILIENEEEIGFAELLLEADVSPSVIQTLEKKGAVEIFVREVLRNPLKNAEIPDALNLTLTEEQDTALAVIARALSTNNYQGILLHGVTGSGKTEIYIRAMKKALEFGKSGLMLVPEIALTPIFSRRLSQVFGDEVAILHSSLTAGERFDEWRRIRNGSARIVIGTRSAVFAPMHNLGIIIVDEEHDASYRQQESPFYNARDVAVVRAKFANAVAVLGSATPALETFHNTKNNKYTYVHLPNRICNRPLAKAEIVDMRNEFRENGKDVIFSAELLNAIEDTHSKHEQSIILLNRRGFSQFVLCRSCGETIRCQNCDITLTFHRRSNVLLCHYCGFRKQVPSKCPFCESRFIYFIGEGTEKIEDLLRRRFSGLRIARIDRDSTRRRKSFEETLIDFSEQKLDMLVGTQMLAKGHDFPNVTLVGVVSVDAGLSLPDFRSAERTFQLLTQVAGRAGRGHLPGRVIIQTFHPENYALQHACTQSYENFYAEEIRFRLRFGYPPFVALASILIHHTNFNYAFDNAQILKKCLQTANSERQARILGPAPAPLARLRGEHRLQMLIKAQNRSKLRELLDIALVKAQENFLDMKAVNVEIDPVNLL